MINIRTDLAVEAREVVVGNSKKEVPGVKVDTDSKDDITVTRVNILNSEGENIMGKPIGNYITIESSKLREKEEIFQERISKLFAQEVYNVLSFKDEDKTMVVGLGNWNVTPDSLGPKVVKQLLVTRHITDDLNGNLRCLSGISPGVLGITGMETEEIIKGIVEKTKPDKIIAVDALASKSMSRVSTTIQISDTGIHPGSGVGNKRKGISKETMGVPVIAIGVPMVVDEATMANDTLDMLIDTLIQETDKGSNFYNLLKGMEKEEKYYLIKEVMNPYIGGLMVTPKEIDTLVEDISKILAIGLNTAIHPGLSFEEICKNVN